MKHPIRSSGPILIGLISTLVACAKSNPEPTASQVVAKVNASEITVSQLNAAMGQVPNLTPEASKLATGKILDQLVNQELLIEKAQQAKLDRDPNVVQAMQTAQRAVLANAWLARMVADVPKPSAQEIKDYFGQHPEYFAARQIYVYRSILVEAPEAQVQTIKQQLLDTSNADRVLNYMRVNNVTFAVTPVTKSSEQLPAELIPPLAKLKEGEVTTFPHSGGLEIVQLLSARPEPVDETRASPFIEKYLLEQRRKERVGSEIQKLRAAAQIQYPGDIKAASSAATTPTAPTDASELAKGIAPGIK